MDWTIKVNKIVIFMIIELNMKCSVPKKKPNQPPKSEIKFQNVYMYVELTT
jgi:hypothetical protein